MWKRTITLAAVTTLLAACAGSAPTGPAGMIPRELAPSFARTEPGYPGQPNCHGQTTAFVAQGGALEDVIGHVAAGGIGNVAKEAGVSARDVHALIREFCTPREPPPPT